MTYSIEQLKTMCAADIAKRSPRHVESVIEELIETAVSLAEREQVRVPKGWPERIPAGLPEYDALLDHIYEHGTAAEGVNERAAALVRAMLEAAQQPQKLSDERIREIWIEHGLDDEDVEGFARAIEREILGGGHE